jgi:Fe2+ or Zn2+ uptake regulation protein
MKKHYYYDAIIELCDNNHLTIEEIISWLEKKFDTVWKSSIYRNVEDLITQWRLKKLVLAWKEVYYEKTKSDHIHLIDTVSWKIIDLEESFSLPFKIPDNFVTKNLDIMIYWEFV